MLLGDCVVVAPNFTITGTKCAAEHLFGYTKKV